MGYDKNMSFLVIPKSPDVEKEVKKKKISEEMIHNY